jgi:DNA-binding NarL/FixJ family response regulator
MVAGARIRVLVCDDHPMIREGVTRLLAGDEGIEVVGAAADGEEGVQLAHSLRPDIVLMDLMMPGVDGVEATRRITSPPTDTRVVILTSFGEDSRVRDAIDAGAVGFVLKDTDGQDLVRAVFAAARGEVPLDPRAAGALLARSRRPPALAGMTAREREVLQLLSTGLANKAIAARLGISQATVKAHLTRIFRHIGAADRTQAALWAREHLPQDGPGGAATDGSGVRPMSR